MNARASAAGLSGVSETLLITLAVRCRQRDPEAGRLCRKLGVDLDRYGASRSTIKGTAARSAWFDARCRWALQRLDNPLFVSLGSGLDTRCERITTLSPGHTFEWIDIDLPDVVRLRQQLLPDTRRCRTLALDVTAPGWLAAIAPTRPRSVVFLAEGLLMYLAQDALAALFRDVAARFREPASVHFIFDWASPAMQRFSCRNPALANAADRTIAFHSSLCRARDIARFDPRWQVVEQYDVMRHAGVGPALLNAVHLLSTTRRFMGCAHAVLG